MAEAQQMAATVEVMHPVFRIGPERNQFNYYATQFMANEKPVYRCCRGSSKDEGMRLFLFKSVEMHWIAVEAGKDTVDPLQEFQTPVFRTLTQDIDDISQPGDVKWQSWNDAKGEWGDNVMTFTTYNIRPTSTGVPDSDAGVTANVTTTAASQSSTS